MVNDVYEADATARVDEGFGGLETGCRGGWVQEEGEVDYGDGVVAAACHSWGGWFNGD